MLRTILLAIAFVAMTTAISLSSAHAQCGNTGQGGQDNQDNQGNGPCIYSVKFVCGLQSPNANLVPPSETPVKPGNYATAVNIHNFHGVPATVAKKAVIANSESEPAGTIGKFTRLTLQPGQALEVDCPDIVTLLALPATAPLPTFIKGFVEVLSPTPLSVTGVYTAQACVTTTSGAACTPTGPVSIDVVPQSPFTGP